MYTSCLRRMPIIDKSKDMGTVVMGKIESGSVRRGDSLIVMPNKVSEFFKMATFETCGKLYAYLGSVLHLMDMF